MSNPFDEFGEDESVADDFFSIIGRAQHAELVEVEKRREREREIAQELRAQQEKSLSQIVGLRSQQELEREADQKDAAEIQRSVAEEAKRKEKEHAKLRDQFPSPNITDT